MDFYNYTKPYVEKIESEMQEILSAKPKEVYGMLPDFLSAGGKRIRPILSILCYKMVGGKSEEVLRPAAIVELFHNFTLIHDDIEDNSEYRRGKPTLHISHGLPLALNTGDALYTLIWKKLVELDLPDEKLIEVCRMCGRGFKAVVDGQGIELSWYQSDRFNINEKEYLDMINGKTAALMGLSCELGAYLGGADEKTCSKLRKFGENIGAAFQIHDDVLNLTGTFEKYQKEIGGDISEGKRTLMMVHALKNANESEKKLILNTLRTHSKKQEDIGKVIEILKKCGSIEYASDISKKLVDQAKNEIADLKESEDRKALMAICDFIIKRQC